MASRLNILAPGRGTAPRSIPERRTWPEPVQIEKGKQYFRICADPKVTAIPGILGYIDLRFSTWNQSSTSIVTRMGAGGLLSLSARSGHRTIGMVDLQAREPTRVWS